MKIHQLTTFLILFLGSQVCSADLAVDESIVIYEHPSQTKHDVTVYNTDELNNLFLEVTPFEVVKPGEQDQELKPLNLASTPDFLVSPNRAILAPNSPTVVRLLNLQNTGDRERVYRINLVPANPPAELQTEEEDAVQSLLQVVVAYQILVIIMPEEPVSVVESERQGNTAVFRNSGTANYLLSDGVQCKTDEPENCVALQSRRIYPGNTWSLDLPFDGPASYKVRTHEGSSELVL